MKGSIKKRGNYWSYMIDIGRDPKTGKRKQTRKSGFKRKKDAESALNQAINELESGVYVAEQDILFKDFAYQWLDDYINRNNPKPGTIRIRKHEINRLLDQLAHLKLKNVNRSTFQKAMDELADRFSNNTMSGVFNTGRAIFRKAAEWEIIKKDPTEYTHRKIKQEDTPELPNYMEKQELGLFLKTVNQRGLPSDDVIFYTLAYTGMRIGELIALRWQDIDITNGTINIHKTLYNPSNNKHEYQLVNVKTKTSRRTIYVDDSIVDLIKKQRKNQNELKILHQYQDNGFVFADDYGLPLLHKFVATRFRRLLKKSDVDKRLTLHSFRHTHVSLMAEAGVPLEAIMERMGHKDDETTRNVYLHVTQDVKKEASHKFAELMRDFM